MGVLTLLVVLAVSTREAHPNLSLFASMGALLVLVIVMVESVVPYLAIDDAKEDEL